MQLFVSGNAFPGSRNLVVPFDSFCRIRIDFRDKIRKQLNSGHQKRVFLFPERLTCHLSAATTSTHRFLDGERTAILGATDRLIKHGTAFRCGQMDS